jgi:hypothetical protein
MVTYVIVTVEIKILGIAGSQIEGWTTINPEKLLAFQPDK